MDGGDRAGERTPAGHEPLGRAERPLGSGPRSAAVHELGLACRAARRTGHRPRARRALFRDPHHVLPVSTSPTHPPQRASAETRLPSDGAPRAPVSRLTPDRVESLAPHSDLAQGARPPGYTLRPANTRGALAFARGRVVAVGPGAARRGRLPRSSAPPARCRHRGGGRRAGRRHRGAPAPHGCLHSPPAVLGRRTIAAATGEPPIEEQKMSERM
jgi:hypothetical protein